jgi:catechol 2,3-dioxygenase-like lactoylglutathione lyase family enzyme
MVRARFDCIFYYVSDLERACAFYARALGLSPFSKDVVARFRIDGVLFELVPGADERVLSGEGNARLALTVDDLGEATEELRALGVPVSDIVQVANGRLARLQDPDGNEIVLWEYRSPNRGPTL